MADFGDLPGFDKHYSHSRQRYKRTNEQAKANDGFGVIRMSNKTGFLTRTQIHRVRAKWIELRHNAVAVSKAFGGKVHPSTIRSYARRMKWDEWEKKLEEAKQNEIIANSIQDEVVARTVTINFIDQRIEWLKKNHSEKVPKDVDAAVDKLARLRELLVGNADSRAGMDKAAVFAFLRGLSPAEREQLAQEWDAMEEAKKA